MEINLENYSVDATIDKVIEYEKVYSNHYKKGWSFISESHTDYCIQVHPYKKGNVLLFWISEMMYWAFRNAYAEDFMMNFGVKVGVSSCLYTGEEYKKRLLALKRSSIIDAILETL